MKILATSDLHGELPEIEPCDVLIIAGDICPVRGSHNPAAQARWIADKFHPWTQDVPAEEIVLVAGNHDFVCEKHPDFMKQDSFRWHYLQDESLELDSVKFYGTPWVPHLVHWAFYGDDRKLEEVFAGVPADTDILVSHGPPYGVSDRTTLSHVGAVQLHNRLTEINPQFVVCGHIHEGYGAYVHEDSGVIVLNVAHMNRQYEPVNDIVDVSGFLAECATQSQDQ